MSTAYYSSFYPAGDSGAKGSAAFVGSIATTIVYLYRRSATALVDADKPNGNVVYTFATADTDVSAVTNGWSVTIPAGTNTLYITAATAYASNTNTVGVDPTTTILPAQWATPVASTTNSLNGVTARSVFLFKRQATDTTAPTVPAVSTTYTFSNSTLTGTLDGWTQAAPDSDLGKYLYATVATALGTGTADTILTSEWKSPVVFSEDGAGYTAYLTNESHTLVADTDGTVSNYTGATGSFVILRDGTDVSASFTLSSFSNPQGLGNGANSIYSGNTYTITSGFDISEDVATLTIRATGSGAHSGIVLDKVFTLSKSKSGATAKLLSIYPSRQIVSFDGAGNLLPATGQDITYTAVKQNTTATVNWTIKDNKGNSITPTSSYLSADTGNSVTMTAAQFNNAIAVNSATGVVITATCDGLTDTTTVVKVVNGTNGIDGTSPLVYDIITSSPVIVKDAPDAVTAGTYSSITIQGRLYDGNNTTNYGWVTITANGDTEATTATNTATTPVTLSPESSSGKSSYIIKLYDQASVSGATLLDTQTITVVFKGAAGSDGTNGTSAIAAIVSNEAHVFPANSSGAITSYVGSGTVIRLYEGATELVYDGVGTANGTWTVSAAATNITVGTLTDSGNFVTVGQHSGVASGTDTSSITYNITGKTSTGQSINVTKTQTFSKSKTGTAGVAGAAAVNIVLTKEASTILAYADGTLAVAANTITGVAKLFLGTTEITPGTGTGQVAWSITSTAGSSATINTANGTYTLTGLDGNIHSATLTITGTYNGSPYTKSFTVTKTFVGYERRTSDPTTGNFEGRAYYNTSTQKLRLYTGGTWTDKTGTTATTTVIADVVNAGSITSAHLATTELITVSAQIANGIITNAKIGDLEVDTLKIAGNAITTGKLGLNSTTSLYNTQPADINLPTYGTTEIAKIENVYSSDESKQIALVESTYRGTGTSSFSVNLESKKLYASGYNRAYVTFSGINTINYNSSGKAPSPSGTTTITASVFNVTSPTYEWYLNGQLTSQTTNNFTYTIPPTSTDLPAKLLLVVRDTSGITVVKAVYYIYPLLTGTNNITIVPDKKGAFIPEITGTAVKTTTSVTSTTTANTINSISSGTLTSTNAEYGFLTIQNSSTAYVIGDAVKFASTIAGFTGGTTYYIASVGSYLGTYYVNLATSYSNAINGIIQYPTTTNTGLSVAINGGFFISSGVAITNGTAIKFVGIPWGGISTTTTYYAKNVTSSTMQLSINSNLSDTVAISVGSGSLDIYHFPGGSPTISYAETDNTIRVYKGSTLMTYSTTTPQPANTWKMVYTDINGSTSGGVTPGTLSVASNVVTLADVTAGSTGEKYNEINYAITVNDGTTISTIPFTYFISHSILGSYSDTINYITTVEILGTIYRPASAGATSIILSDIIWESIPAGTILKTYSGTTVGTVYSVEVLYDVENLPYATRIFTSGIPSALAQGTSIYTQTIKEGSVQQWRIVDSKEIVHLVQTSTNVYKVRVPATLIDTPTSGYADYRVRVKSSAQGTASSTKTFLSLQGVKKVT